MSHSAPLPNVPSQQQQQPQQQLSRQPTAITTMSSAPPLPPTTTTSPSSTTSIVPSIIAGYASGICAVVVGHPMDSAKVWLQTNTSFHHVLTSSSSSGTSRTMSTLASSAASSSSTTSTATSAAAAASVARGAVASTASSSSSSSAVATMSTLAVPTAATHTTTTKPTMMIPNWRMVRALYAGVTGPLVTVGVVQSLNFAIYETARRELFQFQQQYMQWQQSLSSSTTTTTSFDRNRDSLTNVALAGATSGVFLSVVTAPILLVKTTSQVRGIGFRQSLVQVLFGSNTQRSATSTTARSITLLPSWYRVGFGIHSFIEILSRSVYYSTYEGCKRYLRSHREGQGGDLSYASSSDGNTLSERMMSAAAAGIGCWAVIFPLDSIRSRIYAQLAVAPPQQQQQQQQRPLVAWDMAKTMYQQGAAVAAGNDESSYPRRRQQRLLQGLRPFFRGFGVTVLRAGPVAAAALPVYDYVLEQVTRDYYQHG